MTTATRIDEINHVASGGTSHDGIVLYWDHAAIGDEGPAYRDGDESGPLEFAGWGGAVDGSEDDTYHVADFFDGSGLYRGPDQHGVYPMFSE